MARRSSPRLGVLGWLRWSWRQLTSMRTALLLLFLLALASVPGSVLPQRGMNAGDVASFIQRNPELSRWLDRFSLFDVFAAPWFVAIYVLLFVSLAGCVIPRSWQLVRTLRARPPRAPRHLSRLPRAVTFETDTAAETVLARAREQLRGRRFRTDADAESVAAEKGYLHEVGNLLFHLALLALLIAVGMGATYGYRGNILIIEGSGFANTIASYDEFEPGQQFAPTDLEPFTLRLTDFEATYESGGPNRGQPSSFSATMRYREHPDAPQRSHALRPNEPLDVGGSQVYLLGSGYAPTFTVRDGAGNVAYEGAVPFLTANESTKRAEGVVKVPDAAPEQLGFSGTLWPTAERRGERMVSTFPAALQPRVSLVAFQGDLGLDSGEPQSVYRLDTSRMRQLDASTEPLRPGETLELPDGAGSITYTGQREYATLQVNRDPGRLPALAAAVLAIAGVVTSFLVTRRRVWVRASTGTGGRTVVTVAGLSLGGAGVELDEILGRLRVATGHDDGGTERPPASREAPTTSTDEE